MGDRLTRQVRQVEVTDPIVVARRHDYADAFEVRLPGPDQVLPETWVRAGMDAFPEWADKVVGLLGIRDPAQASPDHVGSLRIVDSGPGFIHLETSLPLMHVEIVGRNVAPASRTFTSSLDYKQPFLARIAWMVIGPLHRRMARAIITAEYPAT